MVSTIITKTNGNNRVIDFRDGLSAAMQDKYATMHQGGGKSTNGYPSVIQMTICDFSKGTGNKSVTVSVNLDPTLAYEWLDVCKASIGDVALPLYKKAVKKGGKAWETELVENELNQFAKALHCIPKTADAVTTLLKKVTRFFGDLVTKKVTPGSEDAHRMLGTAFKEAKEAMTATAESPKELSFSRGVNYSYTQDKVNIYKKAADGFAPVSRLTVQHQCFRTSDGDASSYPWYFKITNGEARVMEKDSGAATFDSKSLRNSTEAYILVSDRDMYRMMTRCTHFINCWENAYCIPLVLEGRAKREQEYQERNNNRN